MKLDGILERGCREFAKCSPVSVTVWCPDSLSDDGATAFISARGTTVISVEAGGTWDGLEDVSLCPTCSYWHEPWRDLVPCALRMRVSNGR